MRQTLESIKRRIAQPYAAEAMRVTTNKLTEYYIDTRKLDTERTINELEGIKYEKKWPKGTTPDQAFELAINEAIQIVRGEMR
jgi:hypothetical protein